MMIPPSGTLCELKEVELADDATTFGTQTTYANPDESQVSCDDSYALPRIDEMLDHLKGASYFSEVDIIRWSLRKVTRNITLLLWDLYGSMNVIGCSLG